MSQVHLHFFGDSFTEGFGDPSSLGWVDRVLDVTPGYRGTITASNHGLRGSTTAQIRTTFEAVVGSSDRLGPNPGVVVCGGANDCLDPSPTGPIRTGASLANITSMVERCRSEGWPILVVGSPPVIGANAQIQDLLSSLTADISGVCRELGVPFIRTDDRLAADDRWRRDVYDGAHPGALGYQILADLMLEMGWRDWVRSSP